ncbi:ATP-grasp domain-containing protein [Aeromonas sobria]|uniref:ATP-grasp domain-containing protein n=1 Tax=Aeromonas sobria TaxID=646 RepID=UPI000C6ECF43|nr:ATP-grasp domain-containing protein [Aeromonas sobria]PKQ81580.1 ATP-grasp domain-containing protein [Aeromonas sobria]
MNSRTGVLILSHQLLSMVAPLQQQLAARGLDCYVLSSRPSRAITPPWRDLVSQLEITDDYALTMKDIEAYLARLPGETTLLACISVWDGYRELMAQTNGILGATDLDVTSVTRLRDKLTMRRWLHRDKLSQVQAHPLIDALWHRISDRSAFFIKPRTGLASFGAFRADKLDQPSQLEELWQQACTDQAYAGVFQEEPEFIIEDLIRGSEYCFEVIVAKGQAQVVAVHEKIDMHQQGFTVLESACVCPPVSMQPVQLAEGKTFVARCLASLGITTGLFHIEAKFAEEQGWEIVEINPRIGGAYILESARHHAGVDLLSLWLDSLLSQPIQPAPPLNRRSFFRVFFGQSGRTLSRIQHQSGNEAPLLDQRLFVQEGDRLPEIEREIFIGQALWDISALPHHKFSDFAASTAHHFQVEYQA